MDYRSSFLTLIFLSRLISLFRPLSDKLPGAKVFLKPDRLVGTSNQEGLVMLVGLCDGDRDIIIRKHRCVLAGYAAGINPCFNLMQLSAAQLANVSTA